VLFRSDVFYHPGELRVIAYKNHNRWAHDSVRTTGAAAKLTLRPDRATILANGQDLSFVTLSITDQAGRLVPGSHNRVSFSLNGPGEIVAVDNGDATSFEPFQANQHAAFNGLCLVVVRATTYPGSIILKATSANLESTEVRLQAKPTL